MRVPEEVVLREALCRGLWRTDQELYKAFFDEKSTKKRQEAKALCGQCPVREACLEFAVVNGEIFGVWGGTGRRDREVLRRARR
jgi:hypothetical protein